MPISHAFSFPATDEQRGTGVILAELRNYVLWILPHPQAPVERANGLFVVLHVIRIVLNYNTRAGFALIL